jgi:hypothetical protein
MLSHTLTHYGDLIVMGILLVSALVMFIALITTYGIPSDPLTTDDRPSNLYTIAEARQRQILRDAVNPQRRRA